MLDHGGLYIRAIVHKIRTFLRRWPRVAAALGFGTAGMALATLWWSPVIFQAQTALPYALFIVLPGISAVLAGWALGKPLLDSNGGYGPTRAALRGAGIGSLALLLFAPLFATAYVWTQPVTEHWNIFGLTLLVLIGSTIAVWWLVAAVGAVVGWVLYRLAVYIAG
jgi:hypothetical protein